MFGYFLANSLSRLWTKEIAGGLFHMMMSSRFLPLLLTACEEVEELPQAERAARATATPAPATESVTRRERDRDWLDGMTERSGTGCDGIDVASLRWIKPRRTLIDACKASDEARCDFPLVRAEFLLYCKAERRLVSRKSTTWLDGCQRKKPGILRRLIGPLVPRERQAKVMFAVQKRKKYRRRGKRPPNRARKSQRAKPEKELSSPYPPETEGLAGGV